MNRHPVDTWSHFNGRGHTRVFSFCASAITDLTSARDALLDEQRAPQVATKQINRRPSPKLDLFHDQVLSGC